MKAETDSNNHSLSFLRSLVRKKDISLINRESNHNFSDNGFEADFCAAIDNDC